MVFDPTDDIFVAFQFEVAITVKGGDTHGMSNPLCSAAFAECSGLEATMDAKMLREGGNNYEQIFLPGAVSYGQLALKRGMTPNFDLWRWFNAVTRGGALGLRADIEVKVMHADGSPGVVFHLTDCLPVKLKAPALAAKDGALALEELTVAYGSFRIAEPALS